ncbi:MAG TPA: hypothetical protein VK157_11815 [Phycisphaerales bacterium]|nr:hypothetical protein [Phycisphaerales bacterium]
MAKDSPTSNRRTFCLGLATAAATAGLTTPLAATQAATADDKPKPPAEDSQPLKATARVHRFIYVQSKQTAIVWLALASLSNKTETQFSQRVLWTLAIQSNCFWKSRDNDKEAMTALRCERVINWLNDEDAQDHHVIREGQFVIWPVVITPVTLVSDAPKPGATLRWAYQEPLSLDIIVGGKRVKCTYEMRGDCELEVV